jgi:hypothetical protein
MKPCSSVLVQESFLSVGTVHWHFRSLIWTTPGFFRTRICSSLEKMLD